MAALQELNMRLCLLSRALSLSKLRRSSAQFRLPHQSYHHYDRTFEVDVCSFHSPAIPSMRGSNHHSISGQARSSPKCYSRPRGMDDHRQQLGPVERGEGGSETSMGPLNSVDFENFKDSILLLDDDMQGTKSPKIQNSSKPDHVKYVQQQQMDGQTKEVQAPNYLAMSDKELFAKCRMDTYRASGPGGQHRNKTDSAVRLTHSPTGLVVQASEDRSQHVNRAVALTRLRQTIALEVRDPVELDDYKPSPELLRILPASSSSSGAGRGGGNKKGSSQRVGPNHPDFILGMKCLMDLLSATGGSVSDTGATLGLSTGSLSKLITSSPPLWQGVNKLRASKGLKPLR